MAAIKARLQMPNSANPSAMSNDQIRRSKKQTIKLNTSLLDQ
tara:strand:- start:3971 stop:4096 length:126 start_codon:yes stop_codon:yes gene_type:complete